MRLISFAQASFDTKELALTKVVSIFHLKLVNIFINCIQTINELLKGKGLEREKLFIRSLECN